MKTKKVFLLVFSALALLSRFTLIVFSENKWQHDFYIAKVYIEKYSSIDDIMLAIANFKLGNIEYYISIFAILFITVSVMLMDKKEKLINASLIILAFSQIATMFVMSVNLYYTALNKVFLETCHNTLFILSIVCLYLNLNRLKNKDMVAIASILFFILNILLFDKGVFNLSSLIYYESIYAILYLLSKMKIEQINKQDNSQITDN